MHECDRVLRVYLLGGLRAYWGRDPLPPFPTRKTRSLFAYLVTYRGVLHSRDTLAETFWRGMPTARARRNLSSTLWRLRRTVPPGYLQAESEGVGFLPQNACWLDVEAFEQALDRAAGGVERPFCRFGPAATALHQAVELYRGDLLEGLYEDWALVEAERLRERYLWALEKLLSYHREGGEYRLAFDYAQHILDLDPLREAVHRETMDLYALLGRPDEALAQFAVCRDLLREELDVEPMPETVALYERIRASAATETVPAVPEQREGFSPLPLPVWPAPLPRTPFDDFGQVPLVGRARELEALAALIGQVGQGHGSIVLVEGEAGVGKTRLVQTAARRSMAGEDWLLLWGRCRELYETPPFQGWIEALRSSLAWLDEHDLRAFSPFCLSGMTMLLPELAQSLPSLTPPAVPLDRPGLLRALWQYLAGLSHLRPCLVVLEDLHWSDEATVDALRYLASHVEDLPLLLLATARGEEMPPYMRALTTESQGQAGFQRLLLPRLSEDETAALVEAMLGGPAGRAALSGPIYRRTGGNPFFAVETLKGLYEQGLLARNEAGEWAVAPAVGSLDEADWSPAQGIRQEVRHRLERLDQKSARLAELVAVLGSEVALETLARATGWSKASLLETTDTLLRRQILVEVEERLQFSHDWMQRVLYEELEPARRRWLHALAGRALEAVAPDRVEEIAQHLYLGGQGRRALPYCLEAGERAFALCSIPTVLTCYGWAVEAAERMLASGEESEVDVARRALMQAHERRGQVLDRRGDYEQALAAFRAMEEVAVEAGDRAAVARAIRCRAWLYGDHLDDREHALRETQRSYELAMAAGELAEAAAAMCDIGAYHNRAGDPHTAAEAHRVALDLFRQIGDSAGEAKSLHYLGVTYLFLSRNDEAAEAFRRSLAIREELADRQGIAKILNNLGFLEINQGAFAEAEEHLRRAVAEFEAIGSTGALPFSLLGVGAALRYQGACQEGMRVLERAETLTQRLGQGPSIRALILEHRGWLQVAQGRVALGLETLEEGLALAERAQIPTQTVGLLSRLGHLFFLLGRADQARRQCRQALDRAREISFPAGEAEALAVLGLEETLRNPRQGFELVAQAVRLAYPLGRRRQGEIGVWLAAACLRRGDLEPARAVAGRALGLADAMGLRPLQVEAGLLLGRALAGLGLSRQAEEVLRQALRRADPPGYPLFRWRILSTLSRLLVERGQAEGAGRMWTQARAVVQGLLDDLQARPSLQASFRALAGVQSLLGRVDLLRREGQVRVTLARLGVPGGRPLRPEERVSLTWTPDAGPEDEAVRRRSGKVVLRRHRLLRLLDEAWSQGGEPTEADLAAALGVTLRTIRNDVAALRRAGHRVHTRGSRRPIPPYPLPENP